MASPHHVRPTTRRADECPGTSELALMTWPEVAEAAAADVPVVVCVGATEQHGPHLPVGTDVILPLANRDGSSHQDAAARRAGRDVRHTFATAQRRRRGFPGTVSIRGTTLIPMLTQVLEGLALPAPGDYLSRSGVLAQPCWSSPALGRALR